MIIIDGKAVNVEIRKQMKQAENRKYIIFAGTSEGRQLYEFCTQHHIDAIFCVATEYGKEILCKPKKTKNEKLCKPKRTENIYPVIHMGRMKVEEMEVFFEAERPDMIIDATHPYAVEVTENIRKAAEGYCREQQAEGQVYYRVLRNLTEAGMTEEDMLYAGDAKISYHEDMQQAVSYLQSTEGNILATTGSKQVDELCKLEDFAGRVYLRILPSEEMKAKCLALGFLTEHIICAQGPFSRKSNECILREYDIKYLLTKQSGKTGGYPEKAEAAHSCGVELVVLVPPQETEGVSVEQMCKIMIESE